MKLSLLNIGDVIKTNPREGFWGCAVVLSFREKTDEFYPQCHIGITPLIVRHDFTWEDIAQNEFSILDFERGIRVAPNEYATRKETCIGIYSAKRPAELSIIGRIDPLLVYPQSLTFEIGDGTEGEFPLYGKISPTLGMEAVNSWRKIHDTENWLAENAKASLDFEKLQERLKNEEREKRRARHAKSNP